MLVLMLLPETYGLERDRGCGEPSILNNTRICNNNNASITNTYNEENKVTHGYNKSV